MGRRVSLGSNDAEGADRGQCVGAGLTISTQAKTTHAKCRVVAVSITTLVDGNFVRALVGNSLEDVHHR